MENINTKEELVDYYNNNYPNEYMISFLRLSLTKLGNLSNNNPVRLSENQREDISNILNRPENEFTRDDFVQGLNVLSMDQIGYVGW